MIAFRNNDRRFPFLWEIAAQPAARWNGDNEGPVQYLADTPSGAWAEFLRHEEITDPVELAGVARALWAIEIGDPPIAAPVLDPTTLTGDLATYPDCQDEARRLRALGVAGLTAPSAALNPGAAHGWRVEHSLQLGPLADGRVFVLFGLRPDVVGWRIVDDGRPPADLLPDVRPLS